MPKDLKHKCSIVIPVYKDEMTHNESLVIKNIMKMYNESMLYIICPERLKLPKTIVHLKTERFEDFYFEGIKGYNQLLLSKKFYERFSTFDYILIHQLDAFLFKEQLKFWCDQNYDYIGAPWLRDDRFLAKLLRSKKVRNRNIVFNKVGNGGLSLRKVKTFTNFFKEYESVVEKNIQDELYGIEDVFWSLVAPMHMAFKIPDVKEAARFSLDRKPEFGMKINKSVLPFGCHGFEKNKTKKFWKKYIDGLE